MIPNGYTYCSNSCVLLAAQAQKKEVIPNNELSLLKNILVEKCFNSKEFINNKLLHYENSGRPIIISIFICSKRFTLLLINTSLILIKYVEVCIDAIQSKKELEFQNIKNITHQF